MNQELQAFTEEMLKRICKGHHYSEEYTQQILSYHGSIKLRQLGIKERVTIAVHQRGNHAHVMLITKSISEIDKNTVPIVIFTIKLGSSCYGRLQPGRLDKIDFTSFGKECMRIYSAIQLYIYEKISK